MSPRPRVPTCPQVSLHVPVCPHPFWHFTRQGDKWGRECPPSTPHRQSPPSYITCLSHLYPYPSYHHLNPLRPTTPAPHHPSSHLLSVILLMLTDEQRCGGLDCFFLLRRRCRCHDSLKKGNFKTGNFKTYLMCGRAAASPSTPPKDHDIDTSHLKAPIQMGLFWSFLCL